jgi:hypothetical protein
VSVDFFAWHGSLWVEEAHLVRSHPIRRKPRFK